MSTDSSSSASRREFVATLAGFGTAWAISDWGAVESALAHAAQSVAQQPAPAFGVLTPREAADLGAMVERIMPSDTTPGAREAGVIYFIDRALGSFFKDQLPDARKGLRDLSARAAKRKPTGRSFAQLGTTEQDAL